MSSLMRFSETLPCPYPGDCPQGMVLEEDWCTETGKALRVPLRRYRCQDCNQALYVVAQ